MPILAKAPETKQFSQAPEGLHQAVCVDIVDLGLVKDQFGEREMVRIVWQLGEVDVNNHRYLVSKRYRLSLHEKATLRQDLERWRGKKFSMIELQGFDLEKLIGVNCQLQVSHKILDGGKVWSNVDTVVIAAKHIPKILPLDYVRAKDRPTARGNGETDLGESVPF